MTQAQFEATPSQLSPAIETAPSEAKFLYFDPRVAIMQSETTLPEVKAQMWGELVEENMHDVRRYAWNSTQSIDETEEITQEVMLRLGEKIHLYKPTGPFKHWLWRITLNLLRDRAAHSRNLESPGFGGTDVSEQEVPEGSLLFHAMADERDPAEIYEQKVVVEAVSKAIPTLVSNQRRAIRLTMEGVKRREQVEFLQVSAEVISLRLDRARRNLRNVLQEEVAE